MLAGKYRLIGVLGRGGVGTVHEAETLPDGARVAIKILEGTQDPDAVARFAREARAAGALANDHIVRVVDGGTDAGRPFLVMELLEGEDLGKRLRRVRRLPAGEALHVVEQILDGLGAAHAHGIVHRDLKPDNVLLVERGGDPSFVKIVDFGMSKIARPQGGTAPLPLTRKGVALGTPLYMSPEQVRAAPDLDDRSDLYSVGAILFECLTGRPPHVGESHEQVMVAICMEDAPDPRRWAPEVPTAVAAFVRQALARDKEDRFQSAAEMAQALRIAAGQGEERDRCHGNDRRRRRVRVVAAALVAMVAGAVVTLLAIALAGR